MTFGFRVGRGSQSSPKYWMLQGKNCLTWQVGRSKMAKKCMTSFMDILRALEHASLYIRQKFILTGGQLSLNLSGEP